MKDPISFSDKYFLWLTDKLDDSQKKEFEGQLGADNSLKQLTDELRDSNAVREKILEMDSFDVERGWNAVVERTAESGLTSRKPFKPFFRKYLIPVAAAAVIIGILFAIPLLQTSVPEIHLDEEIETAIAACDEHGMSGAVIEPCYVAQSPEITYEPQKPEIVQSPTMNDAVVSEMLSAKRVTTMNNKEFWLTLPDGSVVHLARNTRIIYPEKFEDTQRDVYIEGEAFFIVAHDAKKKFVVHTKAATTTVYGTEFNVNAPDENTCEVILVNGSVGVSLPDGADKRIAPGDMANVIDGRIIVEEADLEPIKAWNTGHTEFEEWTLGRIMSILSKWYGMKIDIPDAEIAEIKLSGNLDRYDELLPTLESFSELIGIRFYISDDTIVASWK